MVCPISVSEVAASRYWLVIFLRLYYRGTIVFQSLPVSLFFDEALFCLRIFTVHCHMSVCMLVVTGQLYMSLSVTEALHDFNLHCDIQIHVPS